MAFGILETGNGDKAPEQIGLAARKFDVGPENLTLASAYSSLPER